MSDVVTRFYQQQLPEAELKNNTLQAPCPFCSPKNGEKKSPLVVFLNQESCFHGYFRCLNRCVSGGFPLYFARLRGISLLQTPGYDPDRDYFGREVDYPVKNINNELIGFADKLTPELTESFQAGGVGPEALDELRIEGIFTTASFHREVLQHSEFVQGRVDTNFVERTFLT